jgi:hypothetical protein
MANNIHNKRRVLVINIFTPLAHLLILILRSYRQRINEENDVPLRSAKLAHGEELRGAGFNDSQAVMILVQRGFSV